MSRNKNCSFDKFFLFFLILLFAFLITSCEAAKTLVDAAVASETVSPEEVSIYTLTPTIQNFIEVVPSTTYTPTSPVPTNTPVPSPTETSISPLIMCDEPNDNLLFTPWILEGTAGNSAEPSKPYQELKPNALIGKDVLKVVIDIHGNRFGTGEKYDESAIIIDQPNGSWKVVSVVWYRNDRGEEMNGINGQQTILIPLSDFIGLDQDGKPDGSHLDFNVPAGPIHARFWNKEDFKVEIYSIMACISQSGN